MRASLRTIGLEQRIRRCINVQKQEKADEMFERIKEVYLHAEQDIELAELLDGAEPLASAVGQMLGGLNQQLQCYKASGAPIKKVCKLEDIRDRVMNKLMALEAKYNLSISLVPAIKNNFLAQADVHYDLATIAIELEKNLSSLKNCTDPAICGLADEVEKVYARGAEGKPFVELYFEKAEKYYLRCTTARKTEPEAFAAVTKKREETRARLKNYRAEKQEQKALTH